MSLYWLCLVFILEYRFIPPANVRRAMQVMAEAVQRIHGRQLGLWLPELERRWNLPPGASEPPVTMEPQPDTERLIVARPAGELVDSLSRASCPSFSQVEVWCVDRERKRFVMANQFVGGRGNNSAKDSTPRSLQNPQYRRLEPETDGHWGSGSVAWREMMGEILTQGLPAVWYGKPSERVPATAEDENREVAVGLPLRFHEPGGQFGPADGVLYVWCQVSNVLDVLKSIVGEVGRCLNVSLGWHPARDADPTGGMSEIGRGKPSRVVALKTEFCHGAKDRMWDWLPVDGASARLAGNDEFARGVGPGRDQKKC